MPLCCFEGVQGFPPLIPLYSSLPVIQGAQCQPPHSSHIVRKMKVAIMTHFVLQPQTRSGSWQQLSLCAAWRGGSMEAGVRLSSLWDAAAGWVSPAKLLHPTTVMWSWLPHHCFPRYNSSISPALQQFNFTLKFWEIIAYKPHARRTSWQHVRHFTYSENPTQWYYFSPFEI